MIAALLDQAAALQDDKFDHTQPRVSRISECIRSHVATMLGLFKRTFPAYYRIAGHALQNAYAQELERAGCSVRQEEAIPTSIPHVECHIDMIVETPSGQSVVEVKTVEDNKVERLRTLGPRKSAVEQTMLQWKYLHTLWREVPNARLPDEVGILVLGRESFGFNRAWFPLQYDAQLARRLDDKFRSLVEWRDRGELPPKPFARPTAECQWGDKTCPMFSGCWREGG